jgi:hypothetical protein
LRALSDGLDQGVPSVAARALAQPFGCRTTAFGTNVNCFFFSHEPYGKAYYCIKLQF